MARVQDQVSFVFREPEEGDRITEAIAVQALGSEHEIREGDRQRRVVGSDRRVLCLGLPLDLLKRREDPVRLLLKQLGPTFQSLAAREAAEPMRIADQRWR